MSLYKGKFELSDTRIDFKNSRFRWNSKQKLYLARNLVSSDIPLRNIKILSTAVLIYLNLVHFWNFPPSNKLSSESCVRTKFHNLSFCRFFSNLYMGIEHFKILSQPILNRWISENLFVDDKITSQVLYSYQISWFYHLSFLVYRRYQSDLRKHFIYCESTSEELYRSVEFWEISSRSSFLSHDICVYQISKF